MIKRKTIILPFQSDMKFIHKILQNIKPMSNKMGSVLWRRYKLGISLSKIKTGTCVKQTKLKNFNGNVSMGYYANIINWRRNFHNNLDFFLY